jgi:hypothetical protein
MEPLDWNFRYVRGVSLTVPPEAIVERRTKDGPTATTLKAADVGTRVRVWTVEFEPSWATQKARAGTLVVLRILLGAPG